MPVSILAIIFLAGSLMFNSARSGGVGRQIIIGISLGLIYDLMKDLSVASFSYLSMAHINCAPFTNHGFSWNRSL